MNSEFQQKISLQQPVLSRQARKFTDDEHQIKDLVQETMLKAMENEHCFRAGTNLQAWLYVLLRNNFYNDYKRKDFFRSKILPHVVHEQRAVSNEAFSRFIHADIQQALRMIPSECASALYQYAQGYKYAEISEALQVPIGTIKSRISQARISVRSYLSPYIGENNQTDFS